MYQISPRNFSQLNAEINSEIEKVLLKFVSDGKLKIISDENSLTSSGDGEKRKRGRPRKIKSTKKINSSDGTKRKRGRPKRL